MTWQVIGSNLTVDIELNVRCNALVSGLAPRMFRLTID